MTRRSKLETPTDFISAIKANYHIDPEDCFGQSYDRNQEACNELCGMKNVCMVLSAKKLENFAEERFKDLAPFVDTIDWEAIPYDKLLKTLETESFTITDLREVFSHYSKCKDEVAVNTRVNKFIFTNGLKVNNGCITR
jgi:hypothetical protein